MDPDKALLEEDSMDWHTERSNKRKISMPKEDAAKKRNQISDSPIVIEKEGHSQLVNKDEIKNPDDNKIIYF